MSLLKGWMKPSAWVLINMVWLLGNSNKKGWHRPAFVKEKMG
jgi:hypothetical protein